VKHIELQMLLYHCRLHCLSILLLIQHIIQAYMPSSDIFCFKRITSRLSVSIIIVNVFTLIYKSGIHYRSILSCRTLFQQVFDPLSQVEWATDGQTDGLIGHLTFFVV